MAIEKELLDQLLAGRDPNEVFAKDGRRSLAEPLQVAIDNGARKALIPLENKRNFLEVSGDIVERVTQCSSPIR